MKDLQRDFLEKFASDAESLLSSRFEDYSANDVEKLAEYLIEDFFKTASDVNYVESLVKVSQLQARGFASELEDQFGEKVANAFIKKLVSAKDKVMPTVNSAKKAIKGVASKKNFNSFVDDSAKFIKKHPVGAAATVGGLALAT